MFGGVMLQFMVVKVEEDSDLYTQENSEGLAHGTAIQNIYYCPRLTPLNVIFALILTLLLSQMVKR